MNSIIETLMIKITPDELKVIQLQPNSVQLYNVIRTGK